MNPFELSGMAYWKSPECNILWDKFDAKSYAFFLWGPNGDVHDFELNIVQSLDRRFGERNQSWAELAQQIDDAVPEVKADCLKALEQSDGVSMKVHHFGSESFQVRWVPLEE